MKDQISSMINNKYAELNVVMTEFKNRMENLEKIIQLYKDKNMIIIHLKLIKRMKIILY